MISADFVAVPVQSIDRPRAQVLLFLDRSGVVRTGHRKAGVRIVALQVASVEV